MRAPLAAAVLVAALAGAGCAPPDAELRRARLEAEKQTLSRTLDTLEDRLLVNQARVRQWQDLRARHESVSAVACASLDQHADNMALHHLPDRGPERAGLGVRVATAGRADRATASRGASQ